MGEFISYTPNLLFMANAYSTAFQQNRSFPQVTNNGSRSTGLTPYSGQWTTAEVVHLLKRTMFGAAPADIAYFRTLSMNTAVDELLTANGSAPAPPLNNYNSSYPDPNVAAGQPWVTAPYDNLANGFRRNSFKSWWTGLMLNQGRSIEEKMTLFWHNHFATETSVIGDSRYAYKNNALLRQYALGNFKTLVKEVTLDPGMLRYLNGYLNTKNAPDENYARELQELFTVGKDPQLFTEDDVKAAAKVLTGYRIDGINITYFFDSTKHDTSNKQFSSFYNNTVITGQTGAAGAAELDDLLNMIFAQPQVAEHICRKLYRFYIYYTIDASTEANIIQPLAAIFRNNNYEIKPVLETLFKSEHFFDALNRGCVIKTPADYFVGSCREFNTVFPASSALELQYVFWQALWSSMSLNGLEPGEPPNVAGWPAYYQAPGFHEMWINSDTLPKRTQFTDLLINTGYTRFGFTLQFDPIAFAMNLSNPGDPNVLITDTLAILYSIDTGVDLFNYLKSILLSGQSTDSYWTTAWDDWYYNQSDNVAKGVVLARLKPFFQYIMGLAEYHLS